MRTTESADLDIAFDLATLKAVLQEHPVRLAILFGSQATESTHGTSDIDLAVDFDGHGPADSSYNDVFLGLSADLSGALGTDDVDLVDLRTVSPSLAAAIFDTGVLLVGEQAHATELRRDLTASESNHRSARDRLDSTLARIDDHLNDGDSGLPASGEAEDER
ncbi:nucleotidyltransferase domain-containing protein [Haloarculaceae archaeon H-GB2-1]|nr:nucleotidyltransferase domain-containing protein [Haloarculaceae archaeon H-GB1-1]MEA5409639.1 nucleotidyltransferase domain-containing protein [Haloarculaceae archaeon H-GB2-1]